MKEIFCPNCNNVITVNKKSIDPVICPKCLESSGESITMVESSNNPNIKNLGYGLFEKRD